jgi:hydrogenase nickel incorporation protein HypA/HybF
MHEYSIVQSLLDICEQNASQHPEAKVEKITVAIGALSGVEPQLLQTAYDTFKEGTCCDKAMMTIEHVPIEIECKGCDTTYKPEALMMICPSCGSDQTTLIHGKELDLMRMELA